MLKSKPLKELYLNIINDYEVKVLTKMANNVTIGRLGFNDHGPVHSKIVTLNALKILDLLEKGKVVPTIVKEKWGTIEDSRAAIMVSAYLHDVGCTVSRKEHDKLGTSLGEPLARRMLESYDSKKAIKLLPFVLEGILCHLGNYPSTSVEGGIISVADGTDMTKGRSRIPFEIGKRDIHEYSTRAIDEVVIKKGKEKPVKIEVKMNSSAGVFQVEKVLLIKILSSAVKEYLEVVSIIKDGEKIYHDIDF
jgi:metal-dependent HD superfamily phosphatase/phosphodiesterase